MTNCKHNWIYMDLSGNHQKCTKCGMIKSYRKGTHDRSQYWQYTQGCK